MHISIHEYTQHVNHIRNLWMLVINNTEGPNPSVLFFDIPTNPIPEFYVVDNNIINKDTIIRLKIDGIVNGKSQIVYKSIIDPNNLIEKNDINIYLPQYILDQKDNIYSLDIKVSKQNSELVIPIKHIKQCVQVNADLFDGHDTLEFNVVYKSLRTIKIPSFKDLIMHPVAMDLVKDCSRHNHSTEFEDTNCGRLKCLLTIDQKISAVSSEPSITTRNKNLIYGSVYFDNGYVELMNNNLMSIIQHSTVNFDILIITDKTTQKLISKQPFTKYIQPKFHITSTPLDGVEASKNKTLIYDYINIDEYDKILFLDCDIVAVGDVADIFKMCLEHNKLYTVYKDNITINHHRTFHHGFDVVKQSFINEMAAARQYPFNAGQFLFRNSNIMREHFKNLNWFMQVWPGEYFFEQAFMCYYFCKAKITENSLNKKIALISTVVDNSFSLKEKILLHFTAPPLDAFTKINFINNFIKTHYEQSSLT